MGTTVHGLPYPDPEDPVSEVDLAIELLADEVDLSIASQDTTSGMVTIASGWTLSSQRFRKVAHGLFLWVEIHVTRTGSTFTAGSSGNITDVLVATLAEQVTPARPQFNLLGHRDGGTGIWQTQLQEDGELYVCAGPPTQSIAAGDTLRIHGLVSLA